MITKEHRESASFLATCRIIDKKGTWGINQYAPYRSLWEKKFAYYLKENNKTFEYENYAFKIKDERGIDLHYIPDFYVGNNIFIEIVNVGRRAQNHKILNFTNQFPELTLQIYTPSDIKKLYRGTLELNF